MPPTMPPTMPDGRPWPRITVITPTRNQGRFLDAAIRSVLDQGYPNLEYGVLDGASDDDTAAVLARYSHRLAFAVSEPDHGQADAINKGFARTTGEIMTWLNSDDRLAPQALFQAALALSGPDADMVAGICRLVDAAGRPTGDHLTSCPAGPLPLDQLLDLEGCWLRGQFFYQPEVFFTRRIYAAAGGRVDETLHYSMDYDLWVRLAATGARLRVLGTPLALFTEHPDQKTAGGEAYRPELRRVRRDLAARLGRSDPAPIPPPARDRLRLTFVNDLGFAYGAGIAHHRLATACALAGHAVTALAYGCPPPGPDLPPDPARLLDEVAATSPDLVVVGNLHGIAADTDLLGRLAARHPTLFVLHDCWLLTGRCAYPGPCPGWRQGCGPGCPTAGDYPALSRSRIGPAFAAKRRLLAGHPAPALAATSAWLAALAGSVLGRTVPALQPGLDTAVFRPQPRQQCRDRLGLPRDAFIVATAATDVDDRRKGLADVVAALALLGRSDTLLLGLGRTAPDLPDRPDRSPDQGRRFPGHLDDPALVAAYLGAADVFVGPSREEAFGQVFIEAAACGVPSVGYARGGVAEALLHGRTGLLAARPDPEALADAIGYLRAFAPYRQALGRTAALEAAARFSLPALYGRFHQALAATGLCRRLGLAPKISLDPAGPAPLTARRLVPEPQTPQSDAVLRPGRGFDDPERFDFPPYPPVVLRWVRGPRATAHVVAPPGGLRGRLRLTYRNVLAGQELEVHLGGRPAFAGPLAETGMAAFASLEFPVALDAGGVVCELVSRLWRVDAHGRPLAFLIQAATLEPARA